MVSQLEVLIIGATTTFSHRNQFHISELQTIYDAEKAGDQTTKQDLSLLQKVNRHLVSLDKRSRDHLHHELCLMDDKMGYNA